jgi:hypothetical protein
MALLPIGSKKRLFLPCHPCVTGPADVALFLARFGRAAQRSCRAPLPWWLRSHPTIWYRAHHRHVWRRAMLRSLLASARTSTRSIAFIVSTSAVQLRLATMRIVCNGRFRERGVPPLRSLPPRLRRRGASSRCCDDVVSRPRAGLAAHESPAHRSLPCMAKGSTFGRSALRRGTHLLDSQLRKVTDSKP